MAQIVLSVDKKYQVSISKNTLSMKPSWTSVGSLLPTSFSFSFKLSPVLKVYPVLYQERADAIEQEERLARLNTPIFVCQLSFPGVPTVLHFFEPRSVIISLCPSVLLISSYLDIVSCFVAALNLPLLSSAWSCPPKPAVLQSTMAPSSISEAYKCYQTVEVW